MKKRGILNAPLAHELARLGHGDLVVVADCGLPIPRDVVSVDLALTFGTPSFVAVLSALVDELAVERASAADECRGTAVEQWLRVLPCDPDFVSHEELKQQTARAALVVRTGEATAYANVVLTCGVAF